MESYHSYEELRRYEKEGVDYQIHVRYGKTGILIMAPHGGGIEPGTMEIANAVAGDDHHFYSFEGLKCEGNLHLHITSREFDEPEGNHMARNSETILAIHGCKGDKEVVYIGGKDIGRREKVKKRLEKAHFLVEEEPRFPGISPLNICIRGRSGKGVQLEISRGLRRLMFQDLSRTTRKMTTGIFEDFVQALRGALRKPKRKSSL
ncbi:MAG: poly-gamma-glutamate hydrolase family protein [Pseudomonadota bacterium]